MNNNGEHSIVVLALRGTHVLQIITMLEKESLSIAAAHDSVMASGNDEQVEAMVASMCDLLETSEIISEQLRIQGIIK